MTFKYSPPKRSKPTLKFFIDDSSTTILGNVNRYYNNQTFTKQLPENKQQFKGKSVASDQIKHIYDTLPTIQEQEQALNPPNVEKSKSKPKNLIDFNTKNKPYPNHNLNLNIKQVTKITKVTQVTQVTQSVDLKEPIKPVEKIQRNFQPEKTKVTESKPQQVTPKTIIKPITKNFNQAVRKTPDGQLIWDHQDSYAQDLYNLRYGLLPARKIYNLASPELVISPSEYKGNMNKKWVASVYINRFNEEIGFYEKLEKSIMKEGIRNPIIVTSGVPRWRDIEDVDLEYLKTVHPSEWLFCEFLGGSRLYIAQKNNWLVPVIISDWTGKYSYFKQIHTREELATCFMDPPNYIYFTQRGLRTTPPRHIHLDPEHQDPLLLTEIRRNIILKDLKNV